MSYEKFIIDDEMCGMVKRIKKAYAVNEDTLGYEVTKETGPGGHFLDKDHTMRHFRSEFFMPALSDRDSYDGWKERGSLTSMQTANRRYQEIIAAYEAPELPEDADRALKKFIETLVPRMPLCNRYWQLIPCRRWDNEKNIYTERIQSGNGRCGNHRRRDHRRGHGLLAFPCRHVHHPGGDARRPLHPDHHGFHRVLSGPIHRTGHGRTGQGVHRGVGELCPSDRTGGV